MRKIILIIFICFLVGCTSNDAVTPVKDYLNKFKNHDTEVTNAIEELLRQENLSQEQNDLYKLIMKRQYTDLEYKIVNEYYNGRHAIIYVDITVYDYINSRKEALKNGLTKEEAINEQLKQMEKEKKRIQYTLEFHVYYQEERWILETPNTEIIEKIHGLYE